MSDKCSNGRELRPISSESLDNIVEQIKASSPEFQKAMEEVRRKELDDSYTVKLKTPHKK